MLYPTSRLVGMKVAKLGPKARIKYLLRDGNFKKILLPLDDSDMAAEILPVISQLAKRLNAIVLLHRVVDPMEYKPLLDGLAAMAAADRPSLYSQHQRSVPSLEEAVPLAILKKKAEESLTRTMSKLDRPGSWLSR